MPSAKFLEFQDSIKNENDGIEFLEIDDEDLFFFIHAVVNNK